MPSKKPIVTLRTEKETIAKLKAIAEVENRSENKMLETILLKFIREYEKENGIIAIN